MSELHVPSLADVMPGGIHSVARHQLSSKLSEIVFAETGTTPARVNVPDERTAWEVSWPEYDPPFVDVPRGSSSYMKPGDISHPADPRQADILPSFEVEELSFDEGGRPLCPTGRTGLAGRGILDLWGPTPAVDTVLHRHDPQTALEQILFIVRGDTGELALPGGKIDPGETPPQAAAREIKEEANVTGVELDYDKAEEIFRGVSDDSRNTDNAWMEVVAYLLRLDDEQAEQAEVQAGSDAVDVRWVNVAELPQMELFAGHALTVQLAQERLRQTP